MGCIWKARWQIHCMSLVKKGISTLLVMLFMKHSSCVTTTVMTVRHYVLPENDNLLDTRLIDFVRDVLRVCIKDITNVNIF